MIRTTAIALLALAACHDRDVYIGGLQEVMVTPTVPNRNVDILFVIDTSPSMLEEQMALTASFPLMMDALATLPGGLPNVHIGVISTDMGTAASNGMTGPGVGSGPGACSGTGDNGALQHNSVALGGATFISDIDNGDGTRMTNYTGALRDVFSDIASLGANGCGFEQPLAAVKRAIENPANIDFIRPNANLAIVILSDEDDCSLKSPLLLSSDTSTLGALQSFRCTRFGVTCAGNGTTPDAMNMIGPKSDCAASTTSTYIDDVATFTTYLTALKNDPYAVMIGAIVGDPNAVAVELGTPPGGGTPIPQLADVCPSDAQHADPAVRLGQIAGAFPERSIVSSICDDLVLPLTNIGYTAKKLVGDPCLDVALADASDEPGVQAYCEVADGPIGAEESLPMCDDSRTTDCWRLAPDQTMCARSSTNLRLDVRRSTTPPARSYAHLRCLTAGQ